MYVINKHSLVNAAMRSKDLSFDPITLEFSEKFLGLKHDTVVRLAQPGITEEVTKMHHVYLSGQYLSRMNAVAFEEIGRILNDIELGEGLVVLDVFAWLRDMIFRGTMLAVYGKSNPITPDAFEYVKYGGAPIHTLS